MKGREIVTSFNLIDENWILVIDNNGNSLSRIRGGDPKKGLLKHDRRAFIPHMRDIFYFLINV